MSACHVVSLPSAFFIINFLTPYISLNFCFHIVIYIVSSTKRLQHKFLVVYKRMNFVYVCMYVDFFKVQVFLEEIVIGLAQNLQRNSCHLVMVFFF